MQQLVAGYYRPLLRYFGRRISNSAEAQDLTQDVFVRLSHYRDREAIDAPGALVFTVAANVLKDWKRRRASHVSLLSQYGHEGANGFDREAAFKDEICPDRVLIARETLHEMRLALDELSERTKAIFILFRLEKMRQRDIAASFGISVSAVEKHIVKATTHLVLRLNRHD